MRAILLLAAASLILSACGAASPEEAKANRDSLIAKVFPNPADRKGIDIALPLESGGVYKNIMIGYFTREVAETEVRRRVSGYCLRTNSERLSGSVFVRKDSGLSVRTTLDGQQKQVRTIWYGCNER